MIKLMTYKTENDGNKTVLVDDSGHKYLHVLIIDMPVTVRKLPLEEARYMREPIQHGKTKSLQTIVRQYRAIGRKMGITKAAKALLKRAAQ
jgi:hypothetical protein